MTALALAELEASLPDAVVPAAERAGYERGARSGEGRAASVLRPRSTAEVSAIVARCVRAGIRVLPQGANTGLVGASTPDAAGAQVVLSTERLTEPFALDRVDRSVRVGAGRRLSALNAALAPDDLFFPIDVGSDPMVGGMVATNTGGSRLLRYGDVRSRVLGLSVVLGDERGTVVNLGRGLRKDNVGPDWKAVFTGACGAFGIVTEAVLELAGLPGERASALVVPARASDAPALLLELEARFGFELTAFEGMSGAAMRAALEHVPSLRSPFGADVPDYALLVELSRARPRGDVSLREDLETALGELWEAHPDLVDDALFGDGDTIWALRHALSEGVQRAGPLLGFDLAFARGDVFAFRDAAIELLAEHRPEAIVRDFGHVGDGAVHFNVTVPGLDKGGPEAWALRELVVSAAVERFGGTYSAEHGVGPVNARFHERYEPVETRRWSEALAAVTSRDAFVAPAFGGVRS